MRKLMIGGVLLALGVAPVLAVDGPGRALVASNTLQHSNNTLVTDTSSQRSFILPYSGTIRIKWDVRSPMGTQVTAFAFTDHLDNCVKNTSSTTFVMQTCDLRVTAGMVLTLNADGGGNQVGVRNVRLFYTVVDSNGKAIAFEVKDAT